MSSRRNFIQQSVLGLTSAAALPLISLKSGAAAPAPLATSFQTGIAGYTFLKYDLEKSLAIMNRIGVKNLSLKEFHLPLNSSPDKIKEVMGQISTAGINVYAVGVIYMKSKEAVDQAFEYAKNVGVGLIVGVPNPELLDYTEEKVKSTGIRIAIHNHGPEDKLYPSPRDVYDHIKDRDAKMGLCIDIGHSTRAGQNPADAVLAYKARVFDLHIKDVNAAVKEGKAIEMGRGVIDFASLVKALNKIKFAGCASLEYEKDMSDSVPGIAESVGYFHGVVKTVG